MGEREPNPGDDFTITVTRVIRHDDGRVIEQSRAAIVVHGLHGPSHA